jgi:hypothetical protein
MATGMIVMQCVDAPFQCESSAFRLTEPRPDSAFWLENEMVNYQGRQSMALPIIRGPFDAEPPNEDAS